MRYSCPTRTPSSASASAPQPHFLAPIKPPASGRSFQGISEQSCLPQKEDAAGQQRAARTRPISIRGCWGGRGVDVGWEAEDANEIADPSPEAMNSSPSPPPLPPSFPPPLRPSAPPPPTMRMLKDGAGQPSLSPSPFNYRTHPGVPNQAPPHHRGAKKRITNGMGRGTAVGATKRCSACAGSWGSWPGS